MIPVLLALLFLCPASAQAEDWDRVEAVILAEAAGEPFEGQQWVACTMFNRGWNLDGYSGARRSDLEDFVRRQPEATRQSAKLALRSAPGFNCFGADHYVTTDLYHRKAGWWRKLKVIRTVGNHIFLKGE